MELVDLGASRLDENSGVVIAEAKGAPIDDDEAPGYNSSPMMPCLGVACRPAPANERGAAQGIAGQVAGLDGVIVGGHDPRAAKVYGEIADGETALFATGEGYDCRVLCKNQMLAIIVGDDFVLQVDRKNKKIVMNTPGGDIRITKDGVVATEGGGALLQLAKGVAALIGKTILGGRKPVGTVAQAEKVDANLAAIATALTSIAAAVPTANPYIAPTPTGAPGVFIGG